MAGGMDIGYRGKSSWDKLLYDKSNNIYTIFTCSVFCIQQLYMVVFEGPLIFEVFSWCADLDSLVSLLLHPRCAMHTRKIRLGSANGRIAVTRLPIVARQAGSGSAREAPSLVFYSFFGTTWSIPPDVVILAIPGRIR